MNNSNNDIIYISESKLVTAKEILNINNEDFSKLYTREILSKIREYYNSL